ncbi:ATP-dependent DNA helicase [Campylobacter sp. TTU_617]|uniref:ATP-dependent DNA helicase n=2 Tax=unclassified Campylobacter TaxID=2593542 RepID=UPI001907EC45|nr:AAA family ATPase [Campylobacter sp. TTU_617]MBK1971200.1 AAA family ATPase [Campylobacter sp. TTU_617]
MLDKLEKILEKNNVFLSGGAGVGKSFLTNKLKTLYQKQGKNVVSLGSTALSAFNINGITLHSFFCFGRSISQSELAFYDKKQKEKITKLNKILKKTDLIIIDEISMVSANVFDMIVLRLKNANFNGKILIVGDFFQLPPVIKDNNQTLFSNSFYAFNSIFWNDLNFKFLKLSISKRTDNEEFYHYLSFLRKGEVNDSIFSYFEKLLIKETEFDEISDDFTLLCGINKKVDLINSQKLSKLKSELIIFKAQIKKEDPTLEDKVLYSWVKSLNILEELKLKIGAKIIFCLNNWEKNYYNGEQGIIKDIFEKDKEIYIEILKNNGTIVLLEPYTFNMEELSQNQNDLEVNIRASIRQFPIKLAYAITIHKSQGMSIEKLICDINNIFENGQLYVALSRAINPNSLKILYSRIDNFRSYFYNSLKIDTQVLEFYKKNNFLDLEKDEI